MRRTLLVGTLLLGVLVSGAYAITEAESLVSAALSALKFEQLPNDPKRIGSPPKFKVTKETIEYLKGIEGKTITIEGDGSVKVSKQ